MRYKYTFRLSLVGLFLGIIVSMTLYRYFMINDIVLDQIITVNLHVADVYNQHVIERHRSVIDKINKVGHLNLLQDTNFINFANDSIRSLTRISSYVSIYDIHGNKIIRNKPLKIIKFYNDGYTNVLRRIIDAMDKYFLSRYMSATFLSKAFTGMTVHTLSPHALVQVQDQQKVLGLLTTYVPIIGDSSTNFAILSVLEINTDLTKLWQDIENLEKEILIVIFIMSVIFCTIIIATSNNADNIIKKQFEVNKSLEKAMMKAESASSAQTKFLANTSHELRTPLNSIIGFSDILLSQETGISKQNYEYLSDINNAGKHLLGIINDILDLSKISADKLTVDHIELDLNKLISSSIRLVKPRADTAQVKLIEDLTTDHVIIKADPKRLKQVFLNLLSNAIKFTNIGGTVTTSMRTNAQLGVVYIKVIDTGIGIAEKDIARTLAPFGQIDSELSRKYDGTGLGLPLTKKLTTLMQGEFDLQSKVGVGTTVTVSFKYSSSIDV